jgi:tRNA (cytidine/uridine-2'-O-)-methyltransferase
MSPRPLCTQGLQGLRRAAKRAATMRPALALIEPDIAGNVGTLLRTAACFAVEAHVVEPCGFAFSHAAFRRSAMDYADHAAIVRHADRHAFVTAMTEAGRRLVLLSTAGDTRLDQAEFRAGDVLMLGSESSGAPADMHDAAAIVVRIPLAAGLRSLNVAVAGGIALAEALRQTGGFAP